MADGVLLLCHGNTIKRYLCLFVSLTCFYLLAVTKCEMFSGCCPYTCVKFELGSGLVSGNIVGHSNKVTVQCESKKNPGDFLTFFPKRFGIFSPNFTWLLYIHIYAGIQIFIQLPATLTKLHHIKRDHHYIYAQSVHHRLKRTLGGRT